MHNATFFEQIEHTEVPWKNTTIHCPVFYYDVGTLSVQFLASLERVQASLPSSRMHPYRVTPKHCVVSITAFEYRDCDIGPYNEVSIAVPIVLDRPAPLFTGVLRKPPAVPMLYIKHLPVTTEIARDAGVDFAGYPKFIADITFKKDNHWVRSEVHENGQHILTLSGRNGAPRSVPRMRTHPITVRKGFMLRCELIISERQQVVGRGSNGIRLELGDHPIAQEVRKLKLGKVLAYQYTPKHQAILTPVFESFSV